MANILVVAAHPDDEVLGCGGTIARHVEKGDCVHLIVLSDGVGARSGDAKERREALKRSCETLRIADVIQCDLPDNAFDTVPLLKIIRQIEDALRFWLSLRQWQPSIVYTHSAGDLNIDHRRTFEATITACRPGTVKSIYSYEVPSSTEWGFGFKPTMFVDIAEHADTKEAALKCYNMELRDFPHPRSLLAIEVRQAYWGSVAGVGAAEAFEVIRDVR